MPTPIPYRIGVISKEDSEALDCQEGDEYAVFKPGRESRAFVCALHTGTVDALVAAAQKVLAGLNARIEVADPTAVPVFDGVAELHDALASLAPPPSES